MKNKSAINSLGLNANSRAHHSVKCLEKTFDDYNSRELESMSPGLLRVIESMTNESKDILLYLDGKESCDAVRAYLIGAARVLVRIKSLLSSGKIETIKEASDYIDNFKSRLSI